MNSGPVMAPTPGPLRTLLTGAVMGAADLVPGFSGGTVALVAGIYPRLVHNIRAAAHVVSVVLRARFAELPTALRALDWTFLLVLLGGIVSVALLLASTLDALLGSQPVVMSAVFLGLVLGAATVAPRQLQGPPSVRTAVIVAAAALVTASLLGLRPGASSDPSTLALAAAAAVAVCAMILPGVSGSFLLLLLGAYEPVISAVADRDLGLIAVVASGAIVGLLSFSTLLNWLLRRAHDVVLAVLIGLMLGSARVLWPWPSATGVGDPTLAAPTEQVGAATLAALVAFVAVVAVDRALSRAGDPDAGPPPSSASPHDSR